MSKEPYPEIMSKLRLDQKVLKSLNDALSEIDDPEKQAEYINTVMFNTEELMYEKNFPPRTAFKRAIECTIMC